MMKRLFFRSPASSSSKHNSLPPSLADKQVDGQDEGELSRHIQSSKKGQYGSERFRSSNFKTQNPKSGNEGMEADPVLRRSRSLSSTQFLDQSDSPSSSDSSVHTQNNCHMTRHRVLCDSSRASSISSSDDSSKVLDLYIDGEQQQDKTGLKGEACQNNRARKIAGKRPPKIRCATPASPTGSFGEKAVSNSFRCPSIGLQHQLSPRGRTGGGFEHDSSQDLARQVVKRLSQAQLKNHDHDVPISIEDIYAGSERGFGPSSTEIDQEDFYSSEAENVNLFKNCSAFEAPGDDVDAELRSKLREAEEKLYALSNELEQESFLGDVEFNMPALVNKIRSLTEEKTSLALDVSMAIRKHIDERSSIKEEVKRVEREKVELQSTLEKELDRRSSDWSQKLAKFQEEERRLRQRTKELAEQNVSLQREVGSTAEKETEMSKMMSHFQLQVTELSSSLAAAENENQDLRRHVCELQESYKAAKDERDCTRKNFEVKNEECRGLHRTITRLLRTCNEQEKTIDGLQGVFGESVEKGRPSNSFEKHVHKMQSEQLRLVGVEQALRREVDSYKQEVASLRNENINLLNRLKGCGNEAETIGFKLDQELSARLRCLQMQGLSLLAQSNNLCSQLLEQMKAETRDGTEGCSQFIVDCDIKIHGLRRGSESLSRSLETVSSVLHGKSILVSSESQTQSQEGEGLGQPNDQFQDLMRCKLKAEMLQDLMRCKLKAEMLLTNLLQEKLYAKDSEVEQLQAELATAVRGSDVLRCELQNALDTVSSTTHKMKDLELQMLRRDEKIDRLESEVEECSKELAVARGVLPKVTEERDMMWKEVKQYSENNMLLNSEVNSLKKRIEVLEEELLVKEGQITILKDSLGRPFDLLSTSDHTEEFELE